MIKDFDIVIYGATGFTGKLASLYLMRKAGSTMRVAIAGRNRDKLKNISELCDVKPEIIVADSNQPESISALVKRTKVVLSFAGPFALYGEPLIRACAQEGCDYLDITGETPFIRTMIETYEDDAHESGARLIPFSGFDSVPADLAVFSLLRAAKIKRVSVDDLVFYYTLRGGLNGGTLASALNMSKENVGKSFYDAHCLISTHRKQKLRFPQLGAQFEPALKKWSAPFFMSPVNSAVVHRSNFLTQSKAFEYQERMLVNGSLGFMKAGLISGGLVAFSMLTNHKWGQNLAQKLGPKPGEGPSDKARAQGFFRGQLIGRSRGKPRIKFTIQRSGDPGNEITVALACESALLAAERNFVTDRTGFLTPSVAFGQKLVDRLSGAGFQFDTQWLKEDSPSK